MVSGPPWPGSVVEGSGRERRDLDGSVDWEKGVMGEVRPAEVLVAPFVD